MMRKRLYPLSLAAMIAVSLLAGFTAAWFVADSPWVTSIWASGTLRGSIALSDGEYGVPSDALGAPVNVKNEGSLSFIFQLSIEVADEEIATGIFVSDIIKEVTFAPGAGVNVVEHDGKYYGIAPQGADRNIGSAIVVFHGEDIPNTAGAYEFDANEYQGKPIDVIPVVVITQVKLDAVSDIFFGGGAVPFGIEHIIENNIEI